MMEEKEVSHLLGECRTMAENCLYTAQAHYVIAQRESWKRWVLLVLPALLAALAGALVACGLPPWIGIIGAVLGGFSALAAALGVDKDAVLHANAGHVLTSLRHEARQLHESFWKEMTHDELYSEVRRLADRYCNIRLALPPTDNSAFEEAREKIHKGRFKPDFKSRRNEGG